MNHQPFETWLLDDKHLSKDGEARLGSHLRTAAPARLWLRPGLPCALRK
jgi:hypothetical protein